MSAPASNPLLDRLFIVFGQPEKTSDVAAFVREYRRALDGYGPNTLSRAASYLQQNHNNWPSLKSCIDACNAEVEQAALSAQASTDAKPKQQMPWEIEAEHARQWAVDYCRTTALGQEAFRKGYGRSLFDYVRSYARECYRAKVEPRPMEKYRPPQDVLAYHGRYARDSQGLVRWDRHILLGEPMPESRSGSKWLAPSNLFKPVPADASEEEPKTEVPVVDRPVMTTSPPRPDVSRTAWEARFGKPPAGGAA